MPLPRPKKGEQKGDFIDRCMGNPTMNKEYPRQDQRRAVCESQWDKGGGAKSQREAYAACAAQHFGPWSVEPTWFAEAFAAVQRGTWASDGSAADRGLDADPYDVRPGGVAVVDISGQMIKGRSSLGGTSTLAVRRTLRAAASDPEVERVLLHVDSPGGTVAGTQELAAEVRRTDAQKPVYAYIEDTGASAAYWVASQAREVVSNSLARIGSIGAYAAVEDTSGEAEKKGVKVHVLSSGGMKGGGVPGAPVSDDFLSQVQHMVDVSAETFVSEVAAGRGMDRDAVAAVADGRLFIGSEAVDAGLSDGVMSFEDALGLLGANGTMLSAEWGHDAAAGAVGDEGIDGVDASTTTEGGGGMAKEQVGAKQDDAKVEMNEFERHAIAVAEARGWSEDDLAEVCPAVLNDVRSAASGEARTAEIDRAKALYAVAPEDAALALSAFTDGKTPDELKVQVAEAHEKERLELKDRVAKLEEMQKEGADAMDLGQRSDVQADASDPAAVEAKAKKEFQAKRAELEEEGFSEKTYVAFQLEEAKRAAKE